MKKYRIDDSSVLVIRDSVFEKFCDYYQTGIRYESGGILIGKISSDYLSVLITDITIPSTKDKRSRCTFERNKKINQRKLDEIWNMTNKESQYLGEWHTHPEVNPTPSSTDKNMIMECVLVNSYNFKGLFLVIVGLTGNIFVGYSDNKNRLRKLEEIRSA